MRAVSSDAILRIRRTGRLAAPPSTGIGFSASPQARRARKYDPCTGLSPWLCIFPVWVWTASYGIVWSPSWFLNPWTFASSSFHPWRAPVRALRRRGSATLMISPRAPTHGVSGRIHGPPSTLITAIALGGSGFRSAAIPGTAGFTSSKGRSAHACLHKGRHR